MRAVTSDRDTSTGRLGGRGARPMRYICCCCCCRLFRQGCTVRPVRPVPGGQGTYAGGQGEVLMRGRGWTAWRRRAPWGRDADGRSGQSRRPGRLFDDLHCPMLMRKTETLPKDGFQYLGDDGVRRRCSSG